MTNIQKLNYTTEMIQQDNLAKQGKPNEIAMTQLKKQIVEDAIEVGLTQEGKTKVSDYDTCFMLLRALVIDKKYV